MSSPNSNPPSRAWAWVATLLTIGVIVTLRLLHSKQLPADPRSTWHAAERLAEEGLSMFSMVALALVAVAGGAVAAAWVALAGLVMWTTGLIGVVVHGEENRAATGLMLVGSAAILLVHLTHAAREVSRRWARLLRPGCVKRSVLILIFALVGASIAYAILPPFAEPGHVLLASR